MMNYKLLVLFLSLIVLFSIPTVYGIECGNTSRAQLPHGFRGYAKYGSSVLASQTVVATLAGNTFTATTNSDGRYALDISRCDNISDTSITFTVCTRSATETGNYSSGADPTEQNLTISSDCPTTPTTTGGGGGGGGAGGGGGGVAVPSEVNLATKADFATTGTTLKQTQGDKAKFTVAATQYTAELTKLTSDSVTITVAGQSTVLNIGDSAQFDVNGDGSNDLSVNLKGIEGGRAEIVYKLLAKAEEKPTEEVPAEVKEEEAKPAEEVKEEAGKAWIGWLIVGVVVVIGLITYFAAKKKKPEIPV